MKKLLLLSLISGVSSSNATLILTEWMANPAALSDDFGEYFEVYNSGATAIPLAGLTISDNGSDSFTIGAGETGSIAPGEFFVFGDSENPTVPSYVDYAWTEGSYFLSNGADEIIVSDTSGTLISMFYSNGDPFGSGTAVALSDISLDDSLQANFIAETANLGGDEGSPGLAGVTAIPEPSSILLGSLGLIGLLRRRR